MKNLILTAIAVCSLNTIQAQEISYKKWVKEAPRLEDSFFTGKIGVCCYSSLAERSAENHENSVFTSIDYQSITNNSQTGFL